MKNVKNPLGGAGAKIQASVEHYGAKTNDGPLTRGTENASQPEGTEGTENPSYNNGMILIAERIQAV